MSWIFIAILAHFFWAWVNVGDKYVVENKVKNPYVYMTWLAFLGVIAIFLIPFINLAIPSWSIFLWLVLLALINFYSALPYIKAVTMEEISRINIWWQLIPVFSLFIGWFAIGDRLNLNQIIALGILISGGALASLHFKGKGIAFSKALPYMIVATLGYAVYGVLFRYITKFMPFSSAFVWFSLLGVLAPLPMFISKKFAGEFKNEIKNLKKGTAGTICGIAIFDNLGILLNVWALSLGATALVFAMEGWQILFVFIIASAISVFYPKLLKEEMDARNLVLKLAALALMIIGVVMVNLT